MITVVRQADNDFEAFLLCQAIEDAGGVPFSVVYVPAHKTAHHPHFDMAAKWHVFGRLPIEEKIAVVDDLWHAALGRNKEHRT